MIITVAGFKGGVGKTVTALHLAAFLSQKSDKVLLIDGDPNHSSLNWAERGDLPFNVCSLIGAAKASRRASDIVIDTEGNPDTDAIKDFAETSDLVVLPTTADILAIEALLNAVDSLSNLGLYGVVLTMIDSRKRGDAEAAKRALERQNIPVFNQMIRRLTAYERAALQGVIVRDSGDRFSRIAWQEYKNLGREILEYAS